jgi:hypothetical protein
VLSLSRERDAIMVMMKKQQRWSLGRGLSKVVREHKARLYLIR